MKIKIHKTRKLNESVLEEERLNEVAPAIALGLARLAPMLKKWGPAIAKKVPFLGGGDDEKKAEAIATALTDKVEVNPLDVESRALTQHTQILDDIRQILQGINASISKLPQDPGALAASGDTGDEAGTVARSFAPKAKKGPAKSTGQKSKYKVVKERKRGDNLKSLL